jgi:hypothetical protein
MPLADRSITFLTGMIIAGLYVILLVGFSQESYMRRDAARISSSADWRADAFPAWPVIHDASKRVCRIEPPLCAALLVDAGERRSCISSFDAIRRFASEPVMALTLKGIRRAMDENP